MASDQNADEATVQWWVEVARQATGPYGTPFVAASILAGTITGDQLICLVGAEEWKTVKSWPQFRRRLPAAKLDHSTARAPSPLPIAKAGAIDWIQVGIVHGLIVNPVLWCLSVASNCGGGTTLTLEAPSYAWEVLLKLFDFGCCALLFGGWFVGAWWLRCGERRGLWVTMATCLATHLYVVTIIIAYACFLIATDGQATIESSQLTMLMFGLGLAIGPLEYAFQNVLALNLWLNRNTLFVQMSERN